METEISSKNIDFSAARDAIEFHWQCLLISRAVFNYSQFGISEKVKDLEYAAPSFYSRRGINFEIKWKDRGFFKNQENAMKLNYWHNANFIIRICGVLDEVDCLTTEKKNEFPIFNLISKLRNKLGAHQDGLKKRKKRELQKINELFTELGIEKMCAENEAHFSLKIDKVAQPLKNKLIEVLTILDESH